MPKRLHRFTMLFLPLVLAWLLAPRNGHIQYAPHPIWNARGLSTTFTLLLMIDWLPIG